jgi:hypothetical protein
MKTLILLILTLFQSIVIAQPSENTINRGQEVMKRVFENHRLFSQIKYSGDFDYSPTISEQAAWDGLNMLNMEEAIRDYAPKLHEFSSKFLKTKNKSIDEFKELKIILSNSYDLNAYLDPSSTTILIPIGLITLAKITGDQVTNSIKLTSLLESKKIDEKSYADGLFKINEHEIKTIKKLLFINTNPILSEKEMKFRNDYIISIGHKYSTHIIFPIIPNLDSYLKINIPQYSTNFIYEANFAGKKINESDFREIGESATVDFLEFFVAHELCHLINKDTVSNNTSHEQEIKADTCAIDGLRVMYDDTENIQALRAFSSLLNISSVLLNNSDIQNRSKTHPHPICRVKEILFNRKFITAVRNTNLLFGEAKHLFDNINVSSRSANKFCN